MIKYIYYARSVWFSSILYVQFTKNCNCIYMLSPSYISAKWLLWSESGGCFSSAVVFIVGRAVARCSPYTNYFSSWSCRIHSLLFHRTTLMRFFFFFFFFLSFVHDASNKKKYISFLLSHIFIICLFLILYTFFFHIFANFSTFLSPTLYCLALLFGELPPQ